MISLDKYSKYMNGLLDYAEGKQKEIVISYGNIDDIFRHLKVLGIDEIEVNKKHMGMIVGFFVGNSGQTELGAKAGVEGKIDKFLGVKLILK